MRKGKYLPSIALRSYIFDHKNILEVIIKPRVPSECAQPYTTIVA